MNPYDVLNVRRNASNAEIKLAFSKLMDKYDLKNYVGDPHFAQKRMADITEAYNTLSDPKKRKEYDKSHMSHVDMHKSEKINNDDVFTPYYNRQKTTEHIHNDYEIAQDKYNKYKNDSDDPISNKGFDNFDISDNSLFNNYNDLTEDNYQKFEKKYGTDLGGIIILIFTSIYIIAIFWSIITSVIDAFLEF